MSHGEEAGLTNYGLCQSSQRLNCTDKISDASFVTVFSECFRLFWSIVFFFLLYQPCQFLPAVLASIVFCVLHFWLLKRVFSHRFVGKILDSWSKPSILVGLKAKGLHSLHAVDGILHCCYTPWEAQHNIDSMEGSHFWRYWIWYV